MFWVILVFLIIAAIATTFNTQENFYTYNSYYKKYCPSCGWRSRTACSKCINCGFCVNNKGQGECVPGDSQGPYFREDCAYWEYGSPYRYYPYANLYPVTNVKRFNPFVSRNITRPFKWIKND